MEALIALMSTPGPRIVGSVLVMSALAKILDIQYFVRHLSRLDVVPHHTVVSLAVGVVALETSLGVAMLLGLWLDWLIPLASAAFVGFGAITWWSVKTGRVESCGCYAELIDMSPGTSLWLDLVFVTLLWSTFATGRPMPAGSPGKVAIVIAAGLIATGLAKVALVHSTRTGRPLVHLGPLKVGRTWRRSWLSEPWAEGVIRGSTIVLFMSPSCSLCKQWVQILDLVHISKGLPGVIGVVAIGPEHVDRLRATIAPKFPLVSMKPWSFKRLTRGELPTAVLVRDGKVGELWVRRLPATLTAEIRRNLHTHANRDARQPARLGLS